MNDARQSPRRRGRIVAAIAAALVVVGLLAAESASPRAPLVTVYASTGCRCCARWSAHLRAAGFAVRTDHSQSLPQVRARLGIPGRYASCHTAVVDSYVVEGHVPASDIRRLLLARPEARGLSVPGMPIGSPGMEGRSAKEYRVYLISTAGKAEVFARHIPQPSSVAD